MTRHTTLAAVLFATLTATLAATEGVLADVAPRSVSCASLVVPPPDAALGRVYHVRYPSHTGQVTFTSDAPIEIIVGTSNRVVGYAVAETSDDGAPTGGLRAGAFRLPVRSLDTGILLRNSHLQGEGFFAAERFPDITFEITGTRDVSETERDEHSVVYAMTLLGDMTIRDTTRPLEIPATVTLMPASDITRNAGPGDLLVLRCAYAVKRSDFNLAPHFVNAELADTIRLDQRIVFTTVSFEERLARASDPEKERRLHRFEALIRDLRDLDAAAAHAETLLADYGDDPEVLNALAWNAVATEGTELARFTFVDDALARANELTGGTDADVLDTTARVHLDRGDLEAAVAWQRKAVEHAGPDGDPALVRKLHDYERRAGLPLTEIEGPDVADLPQTSEAIAKYVAVYKLDDGGFELPCVDEKGRLHLQPPGGQPPQALLHQGGHAFRLASRPEIRLVFVMEHGAVTGFELHQGGEVATATRVAE